MRELAQREAVAHETALQEASQKAARLARLEGQGPLQMSLTSQSWQLAETPLYPASVMQWLSQHHQPARLLSI